MHKPVLLTNYCSDVQHGTSALHYNTTDKKIIGSKNVLVEAISFCPEEQTA